MATSRYKEDFVERERLGKGGYGAVFRVCLRGHLLVIGLYPAVICWV
jgi:hypothetical protein